MSKEMRKSVKPVGTNPGAMYGICKVHKQQVGGGPPISVNFIDFANSYL